MFHARRAVLGIRKQQLLARTFAAPHDCHGISSGISARAFSGKKGTDLQLNEFRKEMELLPGDVSRSPPLPVERASKANRDVRRTPHDSCMQGLPPTGNLPRGALSHVDDAGKASMVNVVAKKDSERVAVASGKVFLGSIAFSQVAECDLTKGDVFTVAKMAGIQGAKRTSSLIPLCHDILLRGVDVTLSLDENTYAVDIRAEAVAFGPTGVEMEALTAVSFAALTVFDMCKAASSDIRIGDVQLESKTGGKSGPWFRS